MMVQTQTGSILVIEDDLRLNRLFCRQLAAAGFTTEGARSIAQARDVLLDSAPPQLVILDLTLADGDGVELLDLLGQDTFRATRVVIVSGDPYASTHGLEGYRVDHVLMKPVSPRGLALLVKDLLN